MPACSGELLASAARLVFLSEAPGVVLKRNAALHLISKGSSSRDCRCATYACLLGEVAHAQGARPAEVAAAVDGDACFWLHGYPCLGANSLLYLQPDELLTAAENAGRMGSLPPPPVPKGAKNHRKPSTVGRQAPFDKPPITSSCQPARHPPIPGGSSSSLSSNRPPLPAVLFMPRQQQQQQTGGMSPGVPAPDASAGADSVAAVAASAAVAAAGKEGLASQKYASVYRSVFSSLFSAAASSGNPMAARGLVSFPCSSGSSTSSSNPPDIAGSNPSGNPGTPCAQPWPFTLVPPGALVSAVPATLAFKTAAGNPPVAVRATPATAMPLSAAGTPSSLAQQQAARRGQSMPAGSNLMALLQHAQAVAEARKRQGLPQTTGTRCRGPAESVASAPASLVLCPAAPAAPAPPDATAAAAAAAAASGLMLRSSSSSQQADADIPDSQQAPASPNNVINQQLLQPCGSLHSWGSSSRSSSLAFSDVAAEPCWAADSCTSKYHGACTDQPCCFADSPTADTPGYCQQPACASTHTTAQASQGKAAATMLQPCGRIGTAATAAAALTHGTCVPASSSRSAGAAAAEEASPAFCSRGCLVLQAPSKPGNPASCLLPAPCLSAAADSSALPACTVPGPLPPHPTPAAATSAPISAPDASAAAAASCPALTLAAEGALRQAQLTEQGKPSAAWFAARLQQYNNTLMALALPAAANCSSSSSSSASLLTRPVLHMMLQQPLSPFADDAEHPGSRTSTANIVGLLTASNGSSNTSASGMCHSSSSSMSSTALPAPPRPPPMPLLPAMPPAAAAYYSTPAAPVQSSAAVQWMQHLKQQQQASIQGAAHQQQVPWQVAHSTRASAVFQAVQGPAESAAGHAGVGAPAGQLRQQEAPGAAPRYQPRGRRGCAHNTTRSVASSDGGGSVSGSNSRRTSSGSSCGGCGSDEQQRQILGPGAQAHSLRVPPPPLPPPSPPPVQWCPDCPSHALRQQEWLRR